MQGLGFGGLWRQGWFGNWSFAALFAGMVEKRLAG